MSNWLHTKKEMIPMLKSLQDFGKACKSGKISVVSNSDYFSPIYLLSAISSVCFKKH